MLEVELAAWMGRSPENVVACASGSAALHLSLEALRIPGSRIAVPDYAMVACPRAVSLADKVPVFIDCDDELLMDIDRLDEACSKQDVSAVMPVHVYGRPVDMEAVSSLKKKYGLQVVEDSAECHGLWPHPCADAVCWSFYRNKIVAGEEGGAVWFRDARSAKLARQLRCLGFTADHDYTHVPRGHNYRMSNAHADLVRDSLRVVADSVASRRRVEEVWDRLVPREFQMPRRESPWVYDLRVPGMDAARQNDFVKKLQGVGLAARHGFKAMTVQQEYKGCRRYGTGKAQRMGSEVVLLPLSPSLEKTLKGDFLDRVAGVLEKGLEGA